MNTISFMTANFVARQVNYNMTKGWGEGDSSTQDYFKPEATFGERFETYIKDAKAIGFGAIDLWTAILNPAWVTDAHIRAANQVLTDQQMTVVSLAGGFGDTVAEFEATCRMAKALGITILGGNTPALKKDRSGVVALLKEHDLKLGLENHPAEKVPQDLLNEIGDGGDGRIGAAVDTGWWGTQGYNAADALEELSEYLFHVHLKDVREAGQHNTCRFGEGIVPLQECVQVLKKIGYDGALSVEHEPEHSDPLEDCKESLQMLKGWLAE